MASIFQFVIFVFVMSIVSAEPESRFICKKNEEYTDCVDKSCVVTCSNFGTKLNCTGNCKPGCICSRGYIKSIRNICIKPTDCENNVCPNDNEVYTDCLSPCGETCANLGEKIICNFLVCNPGCDCASGYFRNSKGRCVLPENCDKPCVENEEWNSCGTCDPTCKDLKPKCLMNDICKKGCFCKPGFVRQNGKCILKTKCPMICDGENYEYSDCGSPCPKTCETINKNLPCATYCVEGCFCKPGFVLNPMMDCVRPEDCPKKVNCTGANEEYSECGNNACQRNCDNFDKDYMCRPICKSGCICKRPFIRNRKGICVHPLDCENGVCNGLNEEYSTCAGNCEERCSNLGSPNCNYKACFEGCDCKRGFHRNSKGVCVPPYECEIYEECTRRNYIFKACGTACPKTCANKDDPPQCSNECVPGCFCKNGYVLDENDNCIRPENCLKGCSDPNAELIRCPNPCSGGTCQMNEFSPCKRHCKPWGCQCKKGYVKWSSTNPRCVPIWKCP